MNIRCWANIWAMPKQVIRVRNGGSIHLANGSWRRLPIQMTPYRALPTESRNSYPLSRNRIRAFEFVCAPNSWLSSDLRDRGGGQPVRHRRVTPIRRAHGGDL